SADEETERAPRVDPWNLGSKAWVETYRAKSTRAVKVPFQQLGGRHLQRGNIRIHEPEIGAYHPHELSISRSPGEPVHYIVQIRWFEDIPSVLGISQYTGERREREIWNI